MNRAAGLKVAALLFVTATLSAQVQPAPGWCSMAHCNDQMTDFLPVASQSTITTLTSGAPYVKVKESSSGVGAGLGCVSNGTNVACSYKRSVDAVVYYNANGTALWSSHTLLDGNTWASAPIIQADGSVVIGDDKNIYKFNGADGSVAWSVPSPGGTPVSLVTMPGGSIVSATDSLNGGPAPLALYSGGGKLIGSIFLYQSGTSGPYYQTVNTPCVNNGSYPHRVYVSTQLNTDATQGALWAIDINPLNPTTPIAPAWRVNFGGPSGASPLCVGNNIYFDGADYTPSDGTGTTIFGVHDSGPSGTVLFHQSLGPTAQRITCNFALDPRPGVGGFWHQVRQDPSIYHRDGTDGHVIDSINVNSLLIAAGAPTPPAGANYWMRGVFTTYGYSTDLVTTAHPYLMVSESDYFSGISNAQNTASYLAMLDITNDSLVWALSIYPLNSSNYSDTPEGAAALVLDSSSNPVIATAASASGAYFVGVH